MAKFVLFFVDHVLSLLPGTTFWKSYIFEDIDDETPASVEIKLSQKWEYN